MPGGGCEPRSPDSISLHPPPDFDFLGVLYTSMVAIATEAVHPTKSTPETKASLGPAAHSCLVCTGVPAGSMPKDTSSHGIAELQQQQMVTPGHRPCNDGLAQKCLAEKGLGLRFKKGFRGNCCERFRRKGLSSTRSHHLHTSPKLPRPRNSQRVSP